MFIGYQRSGHSLIGALIDAHPNAIIGMETDALGLAERGYNRNQILYLVWKRSVKFTTHYKNVWTDYSYLVPNGHQGRFTKLLVIGDKKGGKSSVRIAANPKLLPHFIKKIRVPVKIIHVVRNPFDVITTMYTRNLGEGIDFDRNLLEQKIDLFFKKADINLQLMNNPELSILTIFHEEFIKSFPTEFSKILTFINLKFDTTFIENCKSIIYKEPHKSRNKINWPDDLLNFVQDRIKKYPFLQQYEY